MFFKTPNFSVTYIFAFAVLSVGCSDRHSSVAASGSPDGIASKITQSKVDKPINLKEVTVGMSISKVKGAKQLTDQAYMFNFDYFGGKRVFLVKTDKDGLIYEYKATLDGSFDSLKKSLEEKLAADNGKPIVFDCETTAFKPDDSADINTRECKVSGEFDALTIKEITVQPTAKVFGATQIPTVVLSIELEGTALAAREQAAKEKERIERGRAIDAIRKKDI